MQGVLRCQVVFERLGYICGSDPAFGNEEHLTLPAVSKMLALAEAQEQHPPGDGGLLQGQV